MPIINAKVSEKERQRVRADAEAAGMSLSGWIKFCCIEGRAQRGASTGPDDTTNAAGAAEGTVPEAGDQSTAGSKSPSKPRAARGDRSSGSAAAGPVAAPRGCALCGKARGQLHAQSCYLGGTVSAR